MTSGLGLLLFLTHTRVLGLSHNVHSTTIWHVQSPALTWWRGQQPLTSCHNLPNPQQWEIIQTNNKEGPNPQCEPYFSRSPPPSSSLISILICPRNPRQSHSQLTSSFSDSMLTAHTHTHMHKHVHTCPRIHTDSFSHM